MASVFPQVPCSASQVVFVFCGSMHFGLMCFSRIQLDSTVLGTFCPGSPNLIGTLEIFARRLGYILIACLNGTRKIS